jgi:CPA1 family monovalent cation:H+ antiporter
VLVTVGVALSAFVTSVGIHYVIHWPWISAAAFGALIAATDPVSVVSVFRDANVHSRLRVLLEGESLLNDGTAAVAFGLVIAIAIGSPSAIPIMAARTVGGGLLCGGAIAMGTLLLAGRTDDHLIEITLTTVAAYGSFLLADRWNFSGVLATITAGLVMANAQPFNAISEYGRVTVRAFWEYAAFVANSLVFLLIGLHEAHRHLYAIWLPASLSIVLVLLGRAVAIYPCCFVFSRSSLRVSLRDQHLLFWGGMRGALALALALGLPAGLPHREEIVSVSFAVVSFSIFVQGLSIVPLLRGRKGLSVQAPQ